MMDPASLFDVAGHVALVTGGSDGIGRMISEGLLRAGATVYICGRNQDRLQEALAALRQLGPCDGVAADMGTAAGCEAVHALLAARERQLNILVNNAGAVWAAPIGDFPRSGFEKVMNVNVHGLFELTQRCLPLLRAAASEGRPARVINISSTAGLAPPSSDTFSYSASKAAVVMLSRHLARTLAPDGITVNVIAPGPFRTRMSASDINDDGSHRWAIPLKRVGTPEDMVGAVIYLSSRAGAYLTGTTIPLAGGMTTAD